MKPNTSNNNSSGSPNRPPLCICNLFQSRHMSVGFLESAP
jgi:hypothetical protein